MQDDTGLLGVNDLAQRNEKEYEEGGGCENDGQQRSQSHGCLSREMSRGVRGIEWKWERREERWMDRREEEQNVVQRREQAF